MIFDLITIFFMGVLLLLAIYIVFKFLGKFPNRTVHDVAPYLRPTDMETFQAILGPAEETDFRLRLSPEEFSQIQRKRVHLLYEHLLRMSHNALVLTEWGNMEWTGPQDKAKRQLGQKLAQAGVEFRLYSILALVKLRLWLMFKPLLAVHSLTEMRKVAGIDAVQAYMRLKLTAESLGGLYGREYQQDLSSRL